MPFFSRIPRLAAVLMVCACLPPPALLNALQATGSTLIEAAPFLLGAEIAERLIRRPRALTWFAALLGCGCGPMPGALTLFGCFFCAFGFGAPAALARAGAALTLVAVGRYGDRLVEAWRAARPPGQPGFSARIFGRRGHSSGVGGCRENSPARNIPLASVERCQQSVPALQQLEWLALFTGAGALLSAFATWGAPPTPLLFACGVFIGVLSPCTPGALGLALGLRRICPPCSLGILCSAGLIGSVVPSWGNPIHRRRLEHPDHQDPPEHADHRINARPVYLLIALACLLTLLRDGASLIHPRLLPLIACGGVLALLCVWRLPHIRARRATFFVTLLMAAAPMLGSQAPASQIGETNLDDLYPGEIVRFTGATTGKTENTTLVRYVITCCRADAFPTALRLDRRLPEAENTWIQAEGVIVHGSGQMLLHVRRYRRIPRPNDPFAYR